MAISEECARYIPRKIQEQLKLIFSALGDSIQVACTTRGLDFIYEEGVILIRDENRQRVLDILVPRRARERTGPWRGRQARVGIRRIIKGLWLIELGRTRFDRTLDALKAIDDAFGVGVATPNHVLYLVPGGCCPAGEPEEVPDHADPDPDVCCSTDGKGVSILIGDSGLVPKARRHPWMKGVKGEREDWKGQQIPSYAGHGTFVAGVARCMAPAADIYVADVFKIVAGAAAVLEADAAKRLAELVAERSPDIISLSAASMTRLEVGLVSFEVLLETLRSYKGLVLVAAADNDETRQWRWPGAFPGVVCVGALSANRRKRAEFTNFGGWVDVYAPGTDLVNAFAHGKYTCIEEPHVNEEREFHGMARWSGTSFATPLVAGLIAARMSRTGENGQEAAASLLAIAQAQAIPGVGAVLRPCLDANDANRDPSCDCAPRCTSCSPKGG